ncbi:MAG: glycosyltransferase family 4 protein [Bacteroidales bacterium]|nr:glycosyltransferase family 4 protein [Bacteroidales bacterium]MCF8390044.1 glycosyltransferase family 4 protein [Bacteroidales bacterium]
MKIMHIIPGSGGSFYCGNCLRDSKFVEGMRKSDHSVVKLPMYLPLFADEHDLESEIPVFYGAISMYLKQMFPIFRKAPRWIDNLLNSGPMLKLASSMAGSTNAKGLEEMTVSMLLGEEGEQKVELERMIDWIATNCNPDIIHLSNALLLGLAHRLKEKMNIPVICSLQDEDVWVDVMEPSYRDKVWNLMSTRGNDVAAFVSVSEFYAAEMKKKMNLPEEKLRTVHIGIYPEDYTYMSPGEKERNIGYVSRLNEENGLAVLVDAFIELKKNEGFQDVKLILTGGSTGDDRKFLKKIKRKLHTNRLSEFVEFHEEFESEGLKEYFKKVSVISVPVLNGEAFGIYLLESMASGIPVIQPSAGAFPEIIETSGGGKLFEPRNSGDLAKSLMELLSDPAEHERLSKAGREGVEKHFHIDDQVKKMIDIYEGVRKSPVS